MHVLGALVIVDDGTQNVFLAELLTQPGNSCGEVLAVCVVAPDRKADHAFD